MTESQIQKRAVNLCGALKLCYVGTPNNAKKRNVKQVAYEKAQGLVTSQPDLTVDELRIDMPFCLVVDGIPKLFHNTFGSLCLEIKKAPNEAFTKKGELRKTEHIRNQARRLQRLNKAGQLAVFAEGWEEIESLIKWWAKQGDAIPVFQEVFFENRYTGAKTEKILKVVGWKQY